MAERVWGRRLGDSGGLHSSLERTLKRLRVQVMAPDKATTRVNRKTLLREDPEPSLTGPGARVLALQRIGQFNACTTAGAIGQPECPRVLRNVPPQCRRQ